VNTSSYLSFNTSSIIGAVKTKNSWKKESSEANNSTLSLQIATYENSIETAAFDPVHGKCDALERNKIDLKKQLFSASFVQNSFEFPRQQEKDQEKKPEVMGFRASQRLHGNDQPTSSNNAQIPTADAGSAARKPNFFVRHNLWPASGLRQHGPSVGFIEKKWTIYYIKFFWTKNLLFFGYKFAFKTI
jgi:hypothetical protein